MRRRTVLRLGLGGIGANGLRRLGMSAPPPQPPDPAEVSGTPRQSLDLAGEWRFQLDPLTWGNSNTGTRSRKSSRDHRGAGLLASSRLRRAYGEFHPSLHWSRLVSEGVGCSARVGRESDRPRHRRRVPLHHGLCEWRQNRTRCGVNRTQLDLTSPRPPTRRTKCRFVYESPTERKLPPK